MRLPERERYLRNLAQKQSQKAKTLTESVKGQRSKVAKKTRAKAAHLKELSKKHRQEASEIKRTLETMRRASQAQARAERRAERAVANARTRQVDDRQRVYVPSIGNTGQFDTIYIDTVLEIATYGQGNYRRKTPLQTPVAKALRAWIGETRTEYGDALTAYVCKKALSQNPYIFTTYIYDSDQTGALTNDTLFILDSYAREYIENYQSPIDLRQVEAEADDTVGTEGIMS